jgi:signal transduction histidine kinase
MGAVPPGGTPRVRGGRLYRRYLRYFIGLVSVALVANALLELHAKYFETQALVREVQREKAVAAAGTISGFMDDLLRQIEWSLPAPGDSPRSPDQQLEADYRLFRQTPGITTVFHLDSRGREQLRVSRLGPPGGLVASGDDHSQRSHFREPRLWQPYFSPVYFDRDTGPAMTMAVVDRNPGGGITVAEINLRGIWEVVGRIRVGQSGLAYLTDQDGVLLSHPDVSLVLRRTSLANLPQVSAALEAIARRENATSIGEGLSGEPVITSFANLPGPNWVVFVEQPLAEVFVPVTAALRRTLLVLVAMLALSILASIALAGNVTRPITTLRQSVASMSAGALDERIAVRTGDELELLADDINAMASQLARTLADLQGKSREVALASANKSEFLANMAHEIRTPLTAVIGFSEVLLQEMFGELNAKQADYVRDILDAGRHLLAVMNDVLDLSKVEAGQLVLEVAPVWLPELLQHCVQFLHETATRREVWLYLTVADEVGELDADERRIRQVVFNLLTNALKFTHAGGQIELTARRVGDEVEIAVRDTGVGITPEDQARIFGAFQQVREQTAGNAEGTGLGLAIVQRLVELHGGRIWVESTPGQGSVFTFAVPVRQPAGTRPADRAGADGMPAAGT